MTLVTTESIGGKEFEPIGIVKGTTIQSVHIGKDIGSAFKTLVGGELQSYNEMLNKARALATERMVREAESLGADAVVAVRYSSSSVMQGAAEVMVYGTAIRRTATILAKMSSLIAFSKSLTSMSSAGRMRGTLMV